MRMTVTAKIQLIVPTEHCELLNTTANAYRNACNFVAGYVFQTHNLKQFSLNQELYYEIREKFGLGSQMTQSVFKTVIARYKTIQTNQHQWIQPEFKVPQFDLVWNRDYSLTQDYFSVNTLHGRIKLTYYSKGMEKYFNKEIYKFGTAKLAYKHKKYFLHIPVTFEVSECSDSDICNVVGIDRGINFIVATYNSKHKSGFVSGKTVKQKRGHYKNLRKQLQQVRTPSSRKRLKAIGQRENRWMQDINHRVSKALVETNPEHTLFILEDLTGIRSATEKIRLKNRYVSVSWAFYDLEQKLIYKAMQHYDKVIKVNPAYTSQCCPMCGHTEKANRNKKIHLFCCKNCGYKSNDDRIGAMNLYCMGIDYLVPDTVTAE
ncbi:MAG: transposase [Ruminococcus sp.]|nr:transposase [Ruminococcus sp.]